MESTLYSGRAHTRGRAVSLDVKKKGLSSHPIVSACSGIGRVVQEHALLQDRRHAKALGQNFLTDPSILARIVDTAGPLEGQNVLEIGPGPGGLTREILKRRPGIFVAVEKDPRCVAALRPLADQHPELTLQEGDLLQMDIEQLWNIAKGPWHVISNLPYNVGTEIFIRLLRNTHRLAGMTLMFQKEVADRLVAPCGAKEYGRLSVLTQTFMKVRRVMTLPPGAFLPPPKVFSSVVHLKPQATASLGLWSALDQILRVAFQNRRKMIRHSLLTLWPTDQLDEVMEICCLKPECRPESIEISRFCQMAGLLAGRPNNDMS